MNAPQPHPIWTPADYHETWERAATVKAIRAIADEFPQTVAESPVLADICEAEGL